LETGMRQSQDCIAKIVTMAWQVSDEIHEKFLNKQNEVAPVIDTLALVHLYYSLV
jgi:hypothetical protein